MSITNKIQEALDNVTIGTFLNIEFDEQYSDHHCKNSMWVNRALMSFHSGAFKYIELKCEKRENALPFVSIKTYKPNITLESTNGIYVISDEMFGAEVIGNENSIDHILIQTSISMIKIKVFNKINEYGFWIQTEYDPLETDYREVPKY